MVEVAENEVEEEVEFVVVDLLFEDEGAPVVDDDAEVMIGEEEVVAAA